MRLWDCEPVERDELDRTVSCPTSLSPAVAEVRMDPPIDLLYAVNAGYRVGASWPMNWLTAAGVRKLKGSDGRYFWQPSSMAGQPDMLRFKRAYTLADIGGTGGMKITVDEVTPVAS